MHLEASTIGVVGLGQMGGGIAANLARAGYAVLGYDRKPDAIDRLVQAGGTAATSVEQVVRNADILLTCVEARDAIALADTVLLPACRPGQTYVDHSTVPVPQTRRIGNAFAAKGVGYLDAPVTGGKVGADAGTLRMFVGGERPTAEMCWPLFEAVSQPEGVIYCGPVGMGQVAKVVQQLKHRLTDAARMEAMSFGVRAGLDLDLVARALDIEPDADDRYASLYRAISRGDTDNLSALFSEWAYYLEAAQAEGFRMPMLEAMYAFCRDGELTGRDPLQRPQPSIWNELVKPRSEGA